MLLNNLYFCHHSYTKYVYYVANDILTRLSTSLWSFSSLVSLCDHKHLILWYSHFMTAFFLHFFLFLFTQFLKFQPISQAICHLYVFYPYFDLRQLLPTVNTMLPTQSVGYHYSLELHLSCCCFVVAICIHLNTLCIYTLNEPIHEPWQGFFLYNLL